MILSNFKIASTFCPRLFFFSFFILPLTVLCYSIKRNSMFYCYIRRLFCSFYSTVYIVSIMSVSGFYRRVLLNVLLVYNGYLLNETNFRMAVKGKKKCNNRNVRFESPVNFADRISGLLQNCSHSYG